MFFLPLEGETIFFTGTFKVPQLRDGTSSGQVPLHHSVLRESELLNSEDEIYCCWPLPGQTGVLRNTGCFI